MNDYEQSTVWVGACRYYLGRMTIAVGSFCDALIRNWPSLPADAREIIERDVDYEFARDDEQRASATYSAGILGGYALGHNCDREQWEKVRGLWKQ